MGNFLDKYNIEAPTWGSNMVKPVYLWTKEDFARVITEFGHFATNDCCLKRPAVLDFLWEIVQESLESRVDSFLEDQEREW